MRASIQARAAPAWRGCRPAVASALRGTPAPSRQHAGACASSHSPRGIASATHKEAPQRSSLACPRPDGTPQPAATAAALRHASLLCRATPAGGANRAPPGDAWPYPSLSPGTLQALLQLLPAEAAPGTAWADGSRSAFVSAASQLGGFWLLGQCGVYETGPLAGRPARAVLQVVLWHYPSGASKDKLPELLQELPKNVQLAGGEFCFHIAAWELDADGWPTGKMLNSASVVEKQTDKRTFKKPLTSFRAVWRPAGQRADAHETLRSWTLHVLEKRGLKVVPKARQYGLLRWYKQYVAAAGVEVLLKLDGSDIMMSDGGGSTHAARKRRAGGPEAGGAAPAVGGAGSGSAGGPVRRPRHTCTVRGGGGASQA